MIMKKISGKMKTPILKTKKNDLKYAQRVLLYTKYKYNCESTVIYE